MFKFVQLVPISNTLIFKPPLKTLLELYEIAEFFNNKQYIIVISIYLYIYICFELVLSFSIFTKYI